ncbi:MAG: hypothetical protein LBS16_06140 [Prevotellaceae bacterium]|jgi:cell fate regulator YaaT (PSP1 superfamily)|nr:hypothetical protein [Prevotellaceae bacterium]
MKYTLNNGESNPTVAGFKGNTLQKLSVVNWLADLPETQLETDMVEVQFKNTRKGYYLNNYKLPLEKGEKVAVDAAPGHDIGEVTLTGRLVLAQIKKNNIRIDRYEVKRIFRKARQADLDKSEESKAKEQPTMIRARQIAQDLHLEMKIGDVEYQGDGSKAIFYYIADGRVDFRQLIKVFAEEFRVRIEMKQIGARQEAGRIGGIGPCGRELCCAKWMGNFVSVATTAARCQDISTNPLKLAGQCAKIKCCINFETSTYMDAIKDFPSREMQLETKDGVYSHFKTDVFKATMAYVPLSNSQANPVVLSVGRVKEIIALNERGIKPDTLQGQPASTALTVSQDERSANFQSGVGQDSLTRFDRQKRNKKAFKKPDVSLPKAATADASTISEFRLIKPQENDTPPANNNNPLFRHSNNRRRHRQNNKNKR